MRKFWSYISNEKYSVGCTGQTVYVYDYAGNELAKFKDIKYAYESIFCSGKDILVVKSTGAYFAAYSLETLSLIKKVRFSNVDGSQDDGYCFSADGKYFYNIERQDRSTNHVISVYDTVTFERLEMFLKEERQTNPTFIEADDNGQLFVLGFLRGEDGVMSDCFVSKFNDNGLEEMCVIPEKEYDFYRNFKNLELKGFTDKAKEWSGFKYKGVDMTGMEKMKYPLSELWGKYKFDEKL